MEIRFAEGFGRAQGVVDLLQAPDGPLWVVERAGLRRYDSRSLQELDAQPHGLSQLNLGRAAVFGDTLLLAGSRGRLEGVGLDDGARRRWDLPDLESETLTAVSASGDLVFAIADGHLRGWQVDEDARRATALPRQGEAADFAGGILIQQLGDILLLATNEGLKSYRATVAGVQLLQELGADEGLGVSQPSVLKMFEAHGQSWGILGAAGSSSLSLVQLGANGALTLVDHLIDTGASRFGQISALEVIEVDGHVFVIAGGGDAGLELLRLLPSGQLVHAARLEGGVGLTNITDIAFSLDATHLQIFVSSEAGAGAEGEGIARYELARADLGEVFEGHDLLGSAGDDVLLAQGQGARLHGREGDDMLLATAAGQRLDGGAGADIFVVAEDLLAQDQGRVVIADFEPGRDQLDLSLLTGLRAINQLGVQARHDGITLYWDDLELRVLSQDSSGLRLEDLWPLGWQTPDRLPLGETLPGHDVPRPPDPTPDPVPDPPPTGLLLLGGARADQLQGRAGNDTLHGGGGPDRLEGNDGADRLEGGPGADQLRGGAGNDTLRGGGGADRLEGNDGADRLEGWDGSDYMRGGAGADQLFGQAGNDTLRGDTGDDELRGAGGNDELRGQSGADRLWGGAGDDQLYGGSGADQIRGNSGDDTVFANSGDDRIYGGKGRDLIYGNGGRDDIWGGGGDDVLRGNLHGDHLRGGYGNDRLFGQLGHDFLEGQQGNDRLRGSFGNDTLKGGLGADVFIFDKRNGRDLILDFTPGEDLLHLQFLGEGGAQRFSDVEIRRSGADLLLDIGTGTIRLLDRADVMLDADDFLF